MAQQQQHVGRQFKQHFFVMLSSSVLARLVFVAALPALSRLFAPEQIGQWQLFVSLGVLLAAIVTFRYEIAVVIPDCREQAAAVFGACIWSSVLMSLAVAGVLYVCSEQIARLAGIAELAPLLWLVPCITLAAGIEQACSYWLARREAFVNLAPARVVKALATVGLPLGAALTLGVDAAYLVWGSAVGQMLATGTLIWMLLWRHPVPRAAWLGRRQVWAAAREYAKYPFFVAPYSFVGQLSKRAVLFILAAFASSHVVGLFALALHATFVPLTFIATALNQVIYPRIARSDDEQQLERFITRIITNMAVVAVPGFTYLAVYGSELTRVVLGDAWQGAGPYVSALAAPAFMLLLTSWLDRIFDAKGKQPLATGLQLCYDGLSLGLLYGVLRLGGTPTTAVWSYCIFTAVYNVLWLYLAYRVAGFSTQIFRTLPQRVAQLAAGSLLICGIGQQSPSLLGGLTISGLGIATFQLAYYWFTNNGEQDMSTVHRWKAFWEQQTTPLHVACDEAHYAAYASELKLLFGDVTGQRVLEIGCGDGALYKHLGFDQAASYTGVDLSASMIREFKKHHPDVNAVVDDGAQFADAGAYDLIFSNGVWQYFDRPMLVEHLSRIEKMLAPGGVVVAGSIPWRATRNAYYWGALRNGKRKSVRGYVVSQLRRLLKGDPIGTWYTPDQIGTLTAACQMSLTTYGSHHYPYRFHIVCRRDEEAVAGAERVAA